MHCKVLTSDVIVKLLLMKLWMQWFYVAHPEDVMEIGMPVSVKIINKDNDRRVLGGTLKHAGMRRLGLLEKN